LKLCIFKGVGSKALRVSIAINRAGGQKSANPLQGQAMAAVQAMWYCANICKDIAYL